MPIVYHRDAPVESFSHPYMEILTILAETGEAWMAGQEGVVKRTPGMTLSLPAHLRHGFRMTGDQPWSPYAVHVSPERVVPMYEE